jgi:hypothetical protein
MRAGAQIPLIGLQECNRTRIAALLRGIPINRRNFMSGG